MRGVAEEALLAGGETVQTMRHVSEGAAKPPQFVAAVRRRNGSTPPAGGDAAFPARSKILSGQLARIIEGPVERRLQQAGNAAVGERRAAVVVKTIR